MILLKRYILGMCVATGILFWIFDAVLDSIHKNQYSDLSHFLLTDEPVHEVFLRISIFILLIAIAFAVHSYKHVEEEMDGHTRKRWHKLIHLTCVALVRVRENNKCTQSNIISGSMSVVVFFLKKYFLGMCVFAGMLFWIFDAMLDSIHKNPYRGLSHYLLTDEPVHEFFLRIAIFILFIAIGLIVHSYLHAENTATSNDRNLLFKSNNFDTRHLNMGMVQFIRSCIAAIKSTLFESYLFKRIMQVIHLLSNPNLCLSIMRTFGLPNLESIKYRHRLRAIKYTGNYLARSLDYRSRGVILATHYRFLNDNLTKESIACIAKEGIILWEEEVGGDVFAISLEFPLYDMEGDLCVRFYVNNIPVWTISFTITTGNILGVPDNYILFVTMVQGHGRFDLIKNATKALNDITPVMLLLTSVRAIAASLRIHSIAGITAQEQISTGCMDNIERFSKYYDNLWSDNSGTKINAMVFQLPVIPEYKSLASIKPNHRTRTQNKRQFKDYVYNRVLNTFQNTLRQNLNMYVKPAPFI